MERALAAYRVTSSMLAVVLLIGFNLVPLVGVLWWGWDLWIILVLYWVENGVVGAFNVLKILRAEGAAPAGMRMTMNGRPISQVARGALASFFVVHYGMFWLGHGVFVPFALPLMAGGLAGPDVGMASADWGLVLVAAAGLAFSHGASFVLNYLRRGEYRLVSPGQLFLAPYGRLVILHMTIIFGGIVSIWIGSPIGALLVLIALKTVLDLFFHLREHRRATAPSGLVAA